LGNIKVSARIAIGEVETVLDFTVGTATVVVVKVSIVTFLGVVVAVTAIFHTCIRACVGTPGAYPSRRHNSIDTASGITDCIAGKVTEIASIIDFLIAYCRG
jgi:hypothetical protein